MCLFSRIGIFPSSGRGFFLVSVSGRSGSPPEHHGVSLVPARDSWNVLWGLEVTSNDEEALREYRAIQTHANPRTH